MGFGKKRSSKVGVGAITTNKKKLFAEGGMMDDGKDVDPVSGNDVPVGSLAEEVRDDVDAKLSPGEFVFPADVVRFIGLERLMKMRDQAKKGLMRMNDIGQMGNAEEAGAAADDTFEMDEEEDDDFESEVDDIMKEVNNEETGRQTEMAFNTGGFVNPSYYDIEKAPKNPALDIRYFKDNEGKTFYMPFINNKPMKPMPNGATPTSLTTTQPKETTPPKEDVKTPESLTPAVTGTGIAIVGGTQTGTKTDTVSDADKSASVSGTYTGSNIQDFGKPGMIYQPGGSGDAGEVVLEDLWQGGLEKWQINLGSAGITALASAAGVPGILTMGIRAAINKYGANAVDSFIGKLNQETVARAGGLDLTTTGGVAAAASQIDQLPNRAGQPAASAGATGTGGQAADVGSYVYDQLKDTGLTDAEISNAAQSAVNSVIRGTPMNDAISNAVKTAKPDFGVRLSDMDTDMGGDSSSFGVLLSDMDYNTITRVSKDIGFDWSMMGDFGDEVYDASRYTTNLNATSKATTTPSEESNTIFDILPMTRRVQIDEDYKER